MKKNTKSSLIALLLIFGAYFLPTTSYSQDSVFTDSLENAEELSLKLESMQERKRIYLDLIDSYSAEGQYEKAYANQLLYSAVKDSLFDEDKSKEIGKLEAKYEMERTIEEEKRKKEIEEKIQRDAESRRNNLQYSGILIFIVLLFTGVFMVGRFSLPIRLAEGVVFFAFLLFFEFTLVLLDPYIEELSSGAPAIKLGFNAVLAGLIFPLHSFFEERLKKNIRLK
ncbi:MAG: hypothetical protein COB85_08755 [Bacteroidetes bacterium]|nr:MAG: hypothetical protein COB85_08755 [Bacteroidota bacterium]